MQQCCALQLGSFPELTAAKDCMIGQTICDLINPLSFFFYFISLVGKSLFWLCNPKVFGPKIFVAFVFWPVQVCLI